MAGDASDQVLPINLLDGFAVFHHRPEAVPGSEKHGLIKDADLIGCEFANDLAAAGYQVCKVHPSAGHGAALWPADASAQLRTSLADLGVNWHLGITVKAINQ